jgi:hypothetical protein
VDLAWSPFDLWFKKYLQVGKWNQPLKKMWNLTMLGESAI